MDVSSTTNTYSASNQTQTTTAAGNSLGKEDFLKLLTAQLKAQDPMNPMDSTNFTAQLAQFSSLEQLTNINTGLTNMLTSQTSLQNTMLTSLIGKTVKVNGNTLQLANGQATMSYSLPGDASKVSASIYNASGVLVKQQDLGAQTAGEHAATWNGRDMNGATLPPGQYTFSLDGLDKAGQTLSISPLTYGTVTGVSFENNTSYLSINGTQKVRLGDILEIGG